MKGMAIHIRRTVCTPFSARIASPNGTGGSAGGRATPSSAISVRAISPRLGSRTKKVSSVSAKPMPPRMAMVCSGPTAPSRMPPRTGPAKVPIWVPMPRMAKTRACTDGRYMSTSSGARIGVTSAVPVPAPIMRSAPKRNAEPPSEATRLPSPKRISHPARMKLTRLRLSARWPTSGAKPKPMNSVPASRMPRKVTPTLKTSRRSGTSTPKALLSSSSIIEIAASSSSGQAREPRAMVRRFMSRAPPRSALPRRCRSGGTGACSGSGTNSWTLSPASISRSDGTRARTASISSASLRSSVSGSATARLQEILPLPVQPVAGGDEDGHTGQGVRGDRGAVLLALAHVVPGQRGDADAMPGGDAAEHVVAHAVGGSAEAAGEEQQHNDDAAAGAQQVDGGLAEEHQHTLVGGADQRSRHHEEEGHALRRVERRRVHAALVERDQSTRQRGDEARHGEGGQPRAQQVDAEGLPGVLVVPAGDQRTRDAAAAQPGDG